jgi:hypothetical protein
MTCTGKRSSAGSAVRVNEVPLFLCPGASVRIYAAPSPDGKAIRTFFVSGDQAKYLIPFACQPFFYVRTRARVSMNLSAAGRRRTQENSDRRLPSFPGWIGSVPEPGHSGRYPVNGGKTPGAQKGVLPVRIRGLHPVRRVSCRGTGCAVSPRGWCRPR